MTVFGRKIQFRWRAGITEAHPYFGHQCFETRYLRIDAFVFGAPGIVITRTKEGQG